VFFGKFLLKAKRLGFAALAGLKAFFWDLLDPARSTAVSKQHDRRITDFGATKVFLTFHQFQVCHFDHLSCPSW
jgi:hypothetical protein